MGRDPDGTGTLMGWDETLMGHPTALLAHLYQPLAAPSWRAGIDTQVELYRMELASFPDPAQLFVVQPKAARGPGNEPKWNS